MCCLTSHFRKGWRKVLTFWNPQVITCARPPGICPVARRATPPLGYMITIWIQIPIGTNILELGLGVCFATKIPSVNREDTILRKKERANPRQWSISLQRANPLYSTSSIQETRRLSSNLYPRAQMLQALYVGDDWIADSNASTIFHSTQFAAHSIHTQHTT